MAKQKCHKNINKNNLFNDHLINNRFDGKHKILAGFDSINLSQSKRPIIMVSSGFDPI